MATKYGIRLKAARKHAKLTQIKLFVVYDLKYPMRAESEISILGSMTRAMPASRLMQTLH